MPPVRPATQPVAQPPSRPAMKPVGPPDPAAAVQTRGEPGRPTRGRAATDGRAPTAPAGRRRPGDRDQPRRCLPTNSICASTRSRRRCRPGSVPRPRRTPRQFPLVPPAGRARPNSCRPSARPGRPPGAPRCHRRWRAPQAHPAPYVDDYDGAADDLQPQPGRLRSSDEYDDRPGVDRIDAIDADDDDDVEPLSPGREWLLMGAQVGAGAIAGALVFLAFSWLWGFQPIVAVLAALVVIVGLVFGGTALAAGRRPADHGAGHPGRPGGHRVPGRVAAGTTLNAGPIPIGLSTASVWPRPVEVGFRLAAELGYDGVEVMVWTDRGSQDLVRLRRFARRYGVSVLAVTLASAC